MFNFTLHGLNLTLYHIAIVMVKVYFVSYTDSSATTVPDQNVERATNLNTAITTDSSTATTTGITAETTTNLSAAATTKITENEEKNSANGNLLNL